MCKYINFNDLRKKKWFAGGGVTQKTIKKKNILFE